MTAKLSNRLDNIEIEIKNLLNVQKKTLCVQPCVKPDFQRDVTVGGDLFAVSLRRDKGRACLCQPNKKSVLDNTPQKIIAKKLRHVLRSCRCHRNYIEKFASVSETIQSPGNSIESDSCNSECTGCPNKTCLAKKRLCKRSRSAEIDGRAQKNKRLEIGVRLIGRNTRKRDKIEEKITGKEIIRSPQNGMCLEITKHKHLEEEVVKLKLLLLELNTNASLATSLTKQYKEKFNTIKDATKKKNEKLANQNETLAEALDSQKAALKNAQKDISKYQKEINLNKETIQHYKDLLDEKQLTIQNLAKSARTSKETSYNSEETQYIAGKTSQESTYSDQNEKQEVPKKGSTSSRRKSPVLTKTLQDAVSMQSEKYIPPKKKRSTKKSLGELIKSNSVQKDTNVSKKAEYTTQQVREATKTETESQDEKYENLLGEKYSAFKRLEEALKIKEFEKRMCEEKFENMEKENTSKQQHGQQETTENLKTIAKLQADLNSMSEKYNKLNAANTKLDNTKQLEELLQEKSNAVKMLDEALERIKDNEKLESELHILNEKYNQLKDTNQDLAKELINKNKALVETKKDVEKELSVHQFELHKSYQEIKQLKDGISQRHSQDKDYYAREIEGYKRREYEYTAAMNSLEAKIKVLEAEQSKLKEFSDGSLQTLIAKNQCLQKQYNELYDKLKYHEVDHLQKCVCFENQLDDKKKVFLEEKDELRLLVQELSNVIRQQKIRINYLLSKNHQQKIILFSQKHNLEDMRNQMNQHAQNVDIVRKHNSKLENNLKSLRDSKQFQDSVNNVDQIECLRNAINEEMAKTRIKDKVIDDQANTISQLKQKGADCDCLMKTNEEEAIHNKNKISKLTDKINILTIDWKQEIEKNEYLTENLTEMQNTKDELITKVQDLESQMQKYCNNFPQRMDEQNEIIRTLEHRIMAQKQEFETQRENCRIEREQAVKAAKFSTEKLMETMQDFQRQTESQNQIRHVLTTLLQEKDDKLKSAIVQMSAITFAPDEIKAIGQGKIGTINEIPKRPSSLLEYLCSAPCKCDQKTEINRRNNFGQNDLIIIKPQSEKLNNEFVDSSSSCLEFASVCECDSSDYANSLNPNKNGLPSQVHQSLDAEPEIPRKRIVGDLSSYLTRNNASTLNHEANQNEINTLLFPDVSSDELYAPTIPKPNSFLAQSIYQRNNNRKPSIGWNLPHSYLCKKAGNKIIPILPVKKHIAQKFATSSSSNGHSSSVHEERESYKSLMPLCFCKTKFCTCSVID